MRHADRDADARRGEDFAAADRERRAQRLLDAEGDHVRLLLLDQSVQQDGELVAAQPRQHVALAQAPFEAARDGDQQLVADQVAEAVVDHLEPVEIEVQHGEPIAVAALLEVVQPPPESFHEQRTVPQARQRVQEPDPAQPLLRQHAFGRVGQRPGDSQRPLPCPAHRDAAAHEAAVTAVLVPQAVLVLEELGRPRKVRVERLLERLGVLRMEAANPLFRTADPCRCGQPEHGPPAGRDVELLRAKVPLPEPVGSAFRREGQAFLAPLQPSSRPASAR